MKTNKEEVTDKDFRQKWIDFIANAENNFSFHKYSPERNGVTCLGTKLSPPPLADKGIYKKLEKKLTKYEAEELPVNLDDYLKGILEAESIDEYEDKVEDVKAVKDSKLFCKYTKQVLIIMIRAKVFKKQPSILHSEVVYNTNLLFPCFEAIVKSMNRKGKPIYFVPGEEELEAMSEQLKKMKGKKFNKSECYKADGIMRLKEFDNLEVLLLETSGPFGHDKNSKINFDNSKGMFALLSMLKTIADHYDLASLKTFKRLKLYFVQPSSKTIRLWSMQYDTNGLYNFIHEDKVVLSKTLKKEKQPSCL